MSWIDDVESTLLPQLATELGFHVRGSHHAGHISPCPACNEERRGSQDKRGPVGYVGQKWRCHRCKAQGGPLRMAAYHFLGDVPGKGDERWKELREQLGVESPKSLRPNTTPLPPPPPAPRPNADQVVRLWRSSVSADEDREVRSWLRRRGLDPGAVAHLDLARALPVDGRLPPWAYCGRMAWHARPPDGWSWRLILRAVSPHGHTLSLRARAIARDTPPRWKSLAAAAGPGSAGGLVYANPAARRMLVRGRIGPPQHVVIVEGEPDWLTWSTQRGALSGGLCVIGLWSGSWNPDFSRRIPEGSTVYLRTHPDDAGHAYAARVAETLALRQISLLRLRCSMKTTNSSPGSSPTIQPTAASPTDSVA
ncbi:MAG: hypothetical protein AAFV53_21075 [Myxococcota bacterium]